MKHTLQASVSKSDKDAAAKVADLEKQKYEVYDLSGKNILLRKSVEVNVSDAAKAAALANGVNLTAYAADYPDESITNETVGKLVADRKKFAKYLF